MSMADMMSNKRVLDYQSDDYVQSISKKQKNTLPSPSKVIHLRNLPLDCTESEIITLASPFGHVEHILILKGKGQAFIKMSELNNAAAFVQFYSTIQGTIRAKDFFAQFSTRDEITSHSSVESPNNILLATITNILYPVTIDMLYQLFSKYGSILKILIFSKQGNFQSLIQLATTESAIAAKRELEGTNIYNGCCNLKIQYSSLTNLRIKYNNDKSRDFTNPSLQAGNALISNPIGFGMTSMNSTMSSAMSATMMQQQQQQMPSQVQQVIQQQPPLQQQMSQQSMPQQQQPSQLQQSAGMPMGVTQQMMVPQAPPMAMFPQVATNTVLIVGGLPETDVSPDDLYTLFGVYGDPLRVKIMFNKKDTALIQMNLPQQADLAIQYLNNIPFKGHTIRVNPSKHKSISLPKSGEAQSELTKDYTGSATHRFKLPGSKNYQNIHPPSTTLHLSNLPQDPDIETQMRDLFSKYGHVKTFNLFQNNTKMALIEMGTLEESINSLVALHGHSLDDHTIKVSFAKTSVRAFNGNGHSIAHHATPHHHNGNNYSHSSHNSHSQGNSSIHNSSSGSGSRSGASSASSAASVGK